MKNILITGTKKGIGRYLAEELEKLGMYNIITFSRKNSIKDVSNNVYDVIIHCAFNSSNHVTNYVFGKYVDDNINLTLDLTKLKYRRFIYFSSIDVYPKSDEKEIYKEDTDFDLSKINNLYSYTKLLCEKLVAKNCDDYLILRPSMMLGKYMKKGNLYKLLYENDKVLSLTKDSTFNIIDYNFINVFIVKSIKENIRGIYNLVSKRNYTLEELCRINNIDINTVQFGKFKYITPNISGNKLFSVY